MEVQFNERRNRQSLGQEMAISTTPLYEAKGSQFSALESILWPIEFSLAVNNTLDRYAVALDLSVKPAHITSTEGVIDIDANRQYVMEAGIDFYVLGYGNFKNGDQTVEAARQKFEDVLSLARTDRDLTLDRSGPTAASIGATNDADAY